jgi:hypothetical protein
MRTRRCSMGLSFASAPMAPVTECIPASFRRPQIAPTAPRVAPSRVAPGGCVATGSDLGGRPLHLIWRSHYPASQVPAPPLGVARTMAGPLYDHYVLSSVDDLTFNSFDPTFYEHAPPNTAYPNSNTAEPTHATAAFSYRGFHDAPALNSPALCSDAPLAWISEDPSADRRNVSGYGQIGALER